MSRGIPVPRHETGPECDGCPYREISQGFAPAVGSPLSPIMLVAEALGRDEVAKGRPLVGGSGRVVNALIYKFCKFNRTEMYINNMVKCRPIRRDENGEPELNASGDYINATPEPDQVRECARRYMLKELEAFQGHTIVGLGGTPLKWFTSPYYQITKMHSSIFEPGHHEDCERCEGTGTINQSKRRCASCGGKGYDADRIPHPVHPCPYHSSYKGIRKPPKSRKCPFCDRMFLQMHPLCDECGGEKLLERPEKVCPSCKGRGKRLTKEKKFISPYLRPGQIFFPTFHPAFLMRVDKWKPVAEKDWARIGTLWDELKEEEVQVDYQKVHEDTPPTGRVVIDIETTGGLDPLRNDAEILCYGYSDEVQKGRILEADDSRVDQLLEAEEIVGQNYTLYDAWWIWHHKGVKPKKIIDTRFLGHMLNPDTPNDLTYLTTELADPPIRGYWKAESDYKNDIRKVALIDVDATGRVLAGGLKKAEEQGQTALFWDNVVPLNNVVLDMRIGGMRVDTEKMRAMDVDYSLRIDSERAELPFNTENQSGELKKWLYDIYGLQPETIWNPTLRRRQPTTRDAALTTLLGKLASGHRSTDHIPRGTRREATELINRIRSLRKMSKLVTSFLRQNVDESNYVHPVLNPGGTATLRLSCSGPNAQQIPKDARGIFLPDTDDGWLVSVDLKQAEVIGMLWYAQEWEAMKKCLGGLDAHGVVASLVFGEGYTKKQRDQAKTTTFAILFGEFPETTAIRLGISLQDVLELRRKYFEALPGVERYTKSMISCAQNQGFVQSPFGYRRYLSGEVTEETRAGRQACNAPIQNIPPMVTRAAMIKLHDQLPDGSRLVMQVHDELLVTTTQEALESTIECTRDVLSSPIPQLPVPSKVCPSGMLQFGVDVAKGRNWLSMEDVQ